MKCTKCAKEFKELKRLNKHIKEKHGERFTCEVCNYTCGKKLDLMRHNRTAKHIQLTTGQVLKRKQPKHPEEPVEEVPKPQPEPVKGFEEKAALGCRLKQYVQPAEGQDPETDLNTKIDDIKKLVNNELSTRKGFKVQLQLHIEFYKPTQPDLTCQLFGWSYQHTIHRGTTFKPQEMFPKVLQSIEEFTQRGLGWVINQLLELQVHLAVCRQLRGSTNKPLPKELKDKHAIVNVQNTDQKCFTWSILAKTHEVPHGENGKRVSKYIPFLGVAPNAWKRVSITPVPKPGDLSIPKNWQPLNVISLLPKVSESHVCDVLKPYIVPQIKSSQFGFLKGRSTEDALCYADHIIRTKMVSGKKRVFVPKLIIHCFGINK